MSPAWFVQPMNAMQLEQIRKLLSGSVSLLLLDPLSLPNPFHPKRACETEISTFADFKPKTFGHLFPCPVVPFDSSETPCSERIRRLQFNSECLPQVTQSNELGSGYFQLPWIHFSYMTWQTNTPKAQNIPKSEEKMGSWFSSTEEENTSQVQWHRSVSCTNVCSMKKVPL